VSDAKIDALVDAIKTELDVKRRDAMLREALVATRDNFYYVPLHHQLRPWAMKKNVTAVHNAVDRHESIYTRVD
jgi:peptide/nickel transport system substrate-binding protein